MNKLLSVDQGLSNVHSIELAYASIRKKMQQAIERRSVSLAYLGQPELLAVSKMQAVEAIREAMRLGLRNFGENRPQELKRKAESFSGEVIQFDCIGQVQRNKVKDLVGRCRLIQSLDRLELALALSKRAQELGVVQDCLLQVNFAQESTKSGFEVAQLIEQLGNMETLPNLRLRGLMCMAPKAWKREELLAYFSAFRSYYENLRLKLKDGQAFDVLSMGMSSDYVEAIEAGATTVRIGRELFGERVI